MNVRLGAADFDDLNCAEDAIRFQERWERLSLLLSSCRAIPLNRLYTEGFFEWLIDGGIIRNRILAAKCLSYQCLSDFSPHAAGISPKKKASHCQNLD